MFFICSYYLVGKSINCMTIGGIFAAGGDSGFGVAQVYMTIMKNCGAVKLSTVLSSSTVILNIVLNGVLIFGLFPIPGMGVRGAALATVAATAVQAVWSAAYVVIKMKKLQGVPRHMRRGPVNGFWKRTVPVLLNELIWGGGFTLLP